MSWVGCRWRWSRRRAELLGRGEPIGYDKRVTTTWALAFAQLGGAGPAAGLLRLAACCAAEDIPLPVLLRPGLAAGDLDAAVAPVLVPLLDDDLARDEAVAGLRREALRHGGGRVVEDGLDPVGELGDGGEAHHRRGAFQAVRRAKCPIEVRAVPLAPLQVHQPFFQADQELARLFEEHLAEPVV